MFIKLSKHSVTLDKSHGNEIDFQKTQAQMSYLDLLRATGSLPFSFLLLGSGGTVFTAATILLVAVTT